MNDQAEERTEQGPAPGRRLFGRHVLQRILGQGGMGIVWLARDEELGVNVALKFLAEHLRWDVRAMASLRREVLRARQLTHPGIVRIHDLVVEGSFVAIAMEYLPGGSLADRLAARLGEEPPRAVDVGELLPLLEPLAAALDYAHREAGVVHRDLKPSNILLAADGAPKIADFGVTRSLAESATRTSGLATLGTLAYMGPQQLHDEPPAPSDDIYALGATLYDLLAGSPPFRHGDIAGQIERKLPEPIVSRRESSGITGEAVPSDWEEAIALCLAKEKGNRPASAAKLVETLNRPRVAATSPAKPRRWRRLLALATAMMAVVLAAWWWRLGGQLPPATPLGSDELRAFAAWNLDGDGVDASGRNLALTVQRAVPTEDRFGRIDRALSFNGGAALTLAQPPELRWGGRQPFSAALWVRVTGGAAEAAPLIASVPAATGELAWMMSISFLRPEVLVGGHAREGGVTISGSKFIEPGKWLHLAAVSDGELAALFVDGVRIAQAPLARNRDASAPRSAWLRIGYGPENPQFRFAGDLDEVRLWRRALSDPEVATLAMAGEPPRFALTRSAAGEKEDLAAVIRTEFGPAAQLADWDAIRRWHGDDTRIWADSVGLAVGGGDALVQRAGNRLHGEQRHYFVTRFDGVVPDYYGLHDECGGRTVVLGSWRGVQLRMLAQLPPTANRREALAAGGSDASVRREFAAGERPWAISLSWTVAAGAAAVVQSQSVQLHLADGSMTRVECRFAEKATAIGIDGGRGSKLAREYAPVAGPLRVTLSAVPGRMALRAVSATGATLVFAESVPLAGFSPRDLAQVTMNGIDAAELTAEQDATP